MSPYVNDGKMYLYDILEIKKKRATLWNPKILLEKNPFLFAYYIRGKKEVLSSMDFFAYLLTVKQAFIIMWLEQNRNTVIYILIYVKNNEKAAHILNVSNSIRLNRMPVQTLIVELFLRNLLLGETNELKNRYLHISVNNCLSGIHIDKKNAGNELDISVKRKRERKVPFSKGKMISFE